jgi:phage-related protein
MGDSRRRLGELPEEVRSEIGYALFLAECGESHPSAKRMQGYNAVEVIADYDGDTFRGVYTTKFKDSILRPSLFSEEVQEGLRDSANGIGSDKESV